MTFAYRPPFSLMHCILSFLLLSAIIDARRRASSKPAVNKTESVLYFAGYSHLRGIPTSSRTKTTTTTTTATSSSISNTKLSSTRPSSSSSSSGVATLQLKTSGRDDYEDPPGVRVHESLRAAQASGWPSVSRRGEGRCYTRQLRYCFRATVCGRRCEPVLLRVLVKCTDADLNSDARCNENGRRTSARKFYRCFPVLCYSRVLVKAVGNHLKTPMPEEDQQEFVIVRHRKPKPEYELRAMKKGQTATQSAIFK